jgi:hypothetical protein
MMRLQQFEVLVILSLAGLTAAAAGDLKPFVANYTISWHGMTAGTSTFTLGKSGADLWTYESRTEPHGLFKLATGGISQRSDMRLTSGGIQPLHYVGKDGKSGDRDIDLRFDWQQLRVTGTSGKQLIDAAIAAGAQDDLSVQIALIHELDNGRAPARFQTYGDRGAREYRYIRETTTTLQTPLGAIDTVVFRTERDGSPRITRYWCAPDYGYLPIRAQQLRGDDVEWTMDIRSLQR